MSWWFISSRMKKETRPEPCEKYTLSVRTDKMLFIITIRPDSVESWFD